MEHCTPCKKGTPPLKGEKLQTLYKKLTGWNLVDEHHLEKVYTFSNFAEALVFR